MSDFYVYAGLAGDTDPGRFWSAGLYRSRNGGDAWESLGEKIDRSPMSSRSSPILDVQAASPSELKTASGEATTPATPGVD